MVLAALEGSELEEGQHGDVEAPVGKVWWPLDRCILQLIEHSRLLEHQNSLVND